jgi:hypothetical protein
VAGTEARRSTSASLAASCQACVASTRGAGSPLEPLHVRRVPSLDRRPDGTARRDGIPRCRPTFSRSHSAATGAFAKCGVGVDETPRPFIAGRQGPRDIRWPMGVSAARWARPDACPVASVRVSGKPASSRASSRSEPLPALPESASRQPPSPVLRAQRRIGSPNPRGSRTCSRFADRRAWGPSRSLRSTPRGEYRVGPNVLGGLGRHRT